MVETGDLGIVAKGHDGGFNLFGDFREGRSSVMSRELDAVVFGGIVAGGEVDGPACLELADGVGDGRGGRGFWDDDGGNAGCREDAGGFVDE